MMNSKISLDYGQVCISLLEAEELPYVYIGHKHVRSDLTDWSRIQYSEPRCMRKAISYQNFEALWSFT